MKDILLHLENALTETLNGAGDIPPAFKEALFYAVFPGGKRIRPILSHLLCQDLGGPADDLLLVAQSLELIHCASLVHDDLPALDNDDFRRGKPSVHKAFGEAQALLLGDYMVPLAFRCIYSSPFANEKKVLFSNALSEAFLDVCNGQARDMGSKKDVTELKRTHQLKTGALFRAAAQFAAIATSDNVKLLQAAGSLGMEIGFCFQVVDDYLDTFGSDQQRGRPAGSDARNEKQTFFSMLDKDAGFAFLKEAAGKVESLCRALETLGAQGRELHHTKKLFKSVLARAGL